MYVSIPYSAIQLNRIRPKHDVAIHIFEHAFHMVGSANKWQEDNCRFLKCSTSLDTI